MAAAAGAGFRMAKESMVVPEVGVQDIEQYPTSSLDKEINIYKRMREKRESQAVSNLVPRQRDRQIQENARKREKVEQYPTPSLDKEIDSYKRMREREIESSSIQHRP